MAGRLLRRLHGLSLGEIYLLTSSLGAAAFAVVLLLLPARLTTSPALATVYSFYGRHTWGLVFLGVAVLCAVGFWRPTERRFVIVLGIVVFFQMLWAVGLTIPATLPGAVANLLAPIAWLQLVSNVLIAVVARRRPILPRLPAERRPDRR